MDDPKEDLITLSRPEAGDQVVVIASPGAAIQLTFEPDAIVGQHLAGSNLIIEFDNGARILLVGYGRLLPELTLPDIRIAEDTPGPQPVQPPPASPDQEDEIPTDAADGPDDADQDGADRRVAEVEERAPATADESENARPGPGEHGAPGNQDRSERAPPDPDTGRTVAEGSGFDFTGIGVSTRPLQGDPFGGFSSGPIQTTESGKAPDDEILSMASNDLLVNVIALDGPASSQPDGFSPISNPFTGLPLDGLVIEGTPGDDVLIGTDKGDYILGFEGDDSLFAGDGHNLVDAGPGNDSVQGGPLGDVITGGPGHDTIATQGGPDIVFAGSENDIVTISGIDDGSVDRGEDYSELQGGEGFDTLVYAGAGEAALLDLRIVDDEAIGGFEHFDLRGADGDAAEEANTLALNIEDVLEITGLGYASVVTDRDDVIDNAVLISGDSLDFVATSDDFSKEPRGANVTVDGNVYDLYLPVDPTYDVLLLIQQGVNVPEPE